jgi:hypothetical protein
MVYLIRHFGVYLVQIHAYLELLPNWGADPQRGVIPPF